MPGLHAPAARAAGDARPPPARVGRDARARPRPLRVRRRGEHAEPARRRRARRLDAAAARCRRRDAQLARRRRRPRLRARLPLRGAVLFTHLSRIGEELVLWSTAEFGFARLPENAATGSSMMPQKLNPDVAELARGKAGTPIGRLTGLLATVKGLPLAYDRDLQEDKPPLFAARRDVAGALGALAALVAGLEFDRERLAAAVADPLLRATDAAEALVREGVPFRDAHEQVAARCASGTFAPPARTAPRAAPGPSGVAAALRDARLRLEARSLGSRPRTLVGRDLRRSRPGAPRARLGARPRGGAEGGAAERHRAPAAARPHARAALHAPSTRTRVSFAAAMEQLGGSAIALTRPSCSSRAASRSRTPRACSPATSTRSPCAGRRRPTSRRSPGSVDPGDQRADRRGAPVPGARGRAHDPRALRRPRSVRVA